MSAAQQASLDLPLPGLAQQYLLDPDVVFLNHGSFGACPKPVFASYQQWQRELEANPVSFIGRRLPDLLADARARLAAYLGATVDNVVFVPNATHGMNIVARSLKLQPGDEVLGTNHEYGAVNNTWRFNCAQRGATYVNQPITTPMTTPEAFVDELWAGVSARTRVISISHITSPTALVFPVELVCQRARAAGILTVIDGAHAPGQIELRLDEMGADFYTGNCHKWLSSAKGAAFLYARAEVQELLDPLVVSHGWSRQNSQSTRFLDYFNWTGTHDPAAYLSVPTAIDFQRDHDWPAVRMACHRMLMEARNRILELSDLEPLSPDSMWSQMSSIPLPGSAQDYKMLWEDHQIIVPVLEWNEQALVRISIQAYNSPRDVDRLVNALQTIVRANQARYT